MAVVVAVAGCVVGLGSGLTDQRHAGVFNVIFQFDFFGDRHAVVDNLGCAKFLLQHHVAAFGPQRDCNGFSQNIHASL